MYEVFEHTADVGLRIRAASREELLVEAARGLFSLLVEDLSTVRPSREVAITIAGERLDDLLVDWLSELLFRFETEHLLFSEFAVTFTQSGIDAVARGEAFDQARHRLDHEVKAVTYHGLAAAEADGGWSAEVILDI